MLLNMLVVAYTLGILNFYTFVTILHWVNVCYETVVGDFSLLAKILIVAYSTHCSFELLPVAMQHMTMLFTFVNTVMHNF